MGVEVMAGNCLELGLVFVGEVEVEVDAVEEAGVVSSLGLVDGVVEVCLGLCLGTTGKGRVGVDEADRGRESATKLGAEDDSALRFEGEDCELRFGGDVDNLVGLGGEVDKDTD
jgi:hypothetical protein